MAAAKKAPKSGKKGAKPNAKQIKGRKNSSLTGVSILRTTIKVP
jgi:hypothetical protein